MNGKRYFQTSSKQASGYLEACLTTQIKYDIFTVKVLGNSKRERLNTLTHDVIVNSMDKPKICMSEEVREALMELLAYMLTHVYENPLAKGEEDKAIRMVEDLYSYYETHMEKMPEQYLKQLQKGEMPEIAVCDYIAGMSDQFAINIFKKIFISNIY